MWKECSIYLLSNIFLRNRSNYTSAKGSLTFPSLDVPATWPVAIVILSGWTARLKKKKEKKGRSNVKPFIIYFIKLLYDLVIHSPTLAYIKRAPVSLMLGFISPRFKWLQCIRSLWFAQVTSVISNKRLQRSAQYSQRCLVTTLQSNICIHSNIALQTILTRYSVTFIGRYQLLSNTFQKVKKGL